MNEKLKMCPFLGFGYDPDTKTSYPSIMNCCHHAKPVEPVHLSRQNEYCLTGNYMNCPIFQRDEEFSLLDDFRIPGSPRSLFRKFTWIRVVLIVAFVVISLLILFGLLFPTEMIIPQTGSQTVSPAEYAPTLVTPTEDKARILSENATKSAQLAIETAFALTKTALLQTPGSLTITPSLTSTLTPTYTATLTRTATPTWTFTPTLTRTATPTKTYTPTPTRTASPTKTFTLTPTRTPTRTATSTPTKTQTPTATEVPSLRNLDTPIGSDHQFVIHKVAGGENLSQYASKYDTSVTAILRVNYALNIPLWVDALVVIPDGFDDVAQMPYFQPYKVLTDGITAETLASELAASRYDFLYYNDLKAGEKLAINDWVLVPRSQPAYSAK
jgi:hypothetical protein